MRLNPFKGLPNARQVWAWGMYDLANQSFTLLIVTLFFAIYFQNQIASTPAQGRVLWGIANGLSSAIVVVLGPLLGAMADFGGRKKRWLCVLAVGCSVLTAALAFTGPGLVWLAFALFVLANVMFMGGENFLAAFLPELATRETMSRVSAIGWTMGYIGAMVVLPVAGLMLHFTGATAAGFRLVFLFAGAWFLVNALPTLIFLRERKRAEASVEGRSLARVGFDRLRESMRQAPRFRHLVRFLGSFFVYSCGMSIIIVFAGELAYQHLGAGLVFLAYCWVLSLIAGAGAVFTGFFQHRVGHRTTVACSLVLWILTCVGAASLPAPGSGGGAWLIWVVGAGVGFGLGMTGNASRTLVGVFTPAHKTAEFFGLWGLAYKSASVIGPPVYGVIAAGAGQRPALLVTAGFFGAGLVLLGLVRVEPGRRAAEESEREFGDETDERDLAAAAAISAREYEAVRKAGG
jgi:UMF1 family MFS transporter